MRAGGRFIGTLGFMATIIVTLAAWQQHSLVLMLWAVALLLLSCAFLLIFR